jgi:3-hydroxyisobutyrate dehydrogenase-like beta-hydroxyacid dehydrogenase
MRIGVLGTGMVGKTIATKLVELGHDVTMGSRSADGEALLGWVREAGGSCPDSGHAMQLECGRI